MSNYINFIKYIIYFLSNLYLNIISIFIFYIITDPYTLFILSSFKLFKFPLLVTTPESAELSILCIVKFIMQDASTDIVYIAHS